MKHTKVKVQLTGVAGVQQASGRNKNVCNLKNIVRSYETYTG